MYARPKRTLTAVQLYSAENYAEKVKPIVTADIEQKKVPQQKTIEVIKRRTEESFLAEPIEVQQMFRDRSTKMKEERAQVKNTSSATPTLESFAA